MLIRRVLLFVLMAVMLGSGIYFTYLRFWPYWSAPVTGRLAVVSPFPVLIWCAIWIELEPALTRYAIIAVIVAYGLIVMRLFA